MIVHTHVGGEGVQTYCLLYLVFLAPTTFFLDSPIQPFFNYKMSRFSFYIPLISLASHPFRTPHLLPLPFLPPVPLPPSSPRLAPPVLTQTLNQISVSLHRATKGGTQPKQKYFPLLYLNSQTNSHFWQFFCDKLARCF